MKTFALIAAVAMVVSTVNAEQCETKSLVSNFQDILEDASACSAATEYMFVPPTDFPTAQQAADVCSKCSALVEKAKKKTFPTCTLPIGGADVPINEFFQKVVGTCGSSSGSSTGSSAGSKANVTVGTTPAPAATSKSSASGSKASSSSTVKSPSPTTATPNSAGVVATVSAAVVAVASIAAYAL